VRLAKLRGRFQVLLHSIRKKENVSFKRKGPGTKRWCYIIKKECVPMLPNVPASCCKSLEGGSSKVVSSSRDHLREIKAIIKVDANRVPALFTENTAPQKVIPGF
jgi:hypothetical protein